MALAELLCSRVAGFERIRFINTGSEAVGLALKIARSYTNRPKIVKLEGVYHGANDFAEIGNYSTPEQRGNTPTFALAFVEAVRSKKRELGILLIYDEVIAFRFGYGGAQTRFGGAPDLTALGKIIGGGYPVGAVAGTAEIMEATAPDVGSSGTFTANPVTMRAGLASMQALTEPVFAELEALGERVEAAAGALIRAAGVRAQVCRTGSICSIYFHDRDVRDYRSYYKRATEAAPSARFHLEMLRRGVLLAPTATCFLSRAVTAADEDRLLSAFEACLALPGVADG